MRCMRAVAAVAVMMGAMASCGDESDGGGDPPAGDPPSIERAVTATRAVDRARVELRTTYTGLDQAGDVPAGVDHVAVVQRAAFDRQSHQATAEADLSELAAVVEAGDEAPPGDFRSPPRLVIDGDSVYAQVGPMAHLAGLAPTTWVRRDLDSFTSQPIDNETVALLLQPLGMLELLERPLDQVRVVGAERVRGVATTRVAARVDLTPGAGEAGAGSAAAGNGEPDDALADHFRQLGIGRLPVQVWVGDDGVVRRIEFAIDATMLGRSDQASGAMTTTFEVYAVGEPLGVEVPSGRDVLDYGELQSRLGDGG